MSRVYHEIDHDCVMAICDCEGICAASSRFFWTDYWRVTESLVVLLCSRSFRISCRSRGCFPLERLESDQLSWLLSLSSGYTGICDIESHHPQIVGLRCCCEPTSIGLPPKGLLNDPLK